jgi:hypothetical protein
VFKFQIQKSKQLFTKIIEARCQKAFFGSPGNKRKLLIEIHEMTGDRKKELLSEFVKSHQRNTEIFL